MSKPAVDSTQSDEPAAESTTTTTDGVTVEKTVSRKDEETLQVEFTVSATLNHPVNLVIVEPVPLGVTLDEIGFHSDYWNNWYVEEDHLEHRVDLEPDTDHFTLYGVQADGDTDPRIFLTEPTVDVTHKEQTTTSTDQNLDAPVAQQTTEPEVDSDSRPASPEAAPKGTNPNEESSARTDDPTESTDSSILAELVADIEAADPDDETLAVLRDALDTPETESPTSVQVRLERVEGEVNELTAYTDALEEFLDEHGDGRSLLQSMEAEHERFSTRLDAIEERLETIDEQLAMVEEHATALESLRTDFDAVQSRLADLESGHEETEERTIENQQSVEGVSRLVSELENNIEGVESTVSTQTGDLYSDLQELEDTVVGVRRWQKRFVDLVDVLSAPPALDGDDADTGDVPEATGGADERQ